VFSHTTEYALRAMACLANAPGELVPTATLATRADVPANYLAKVLQQLAGAGLIIGRRGVGGGYRLARSPADINLLEIVRTVTDLEKGTGECRSCNAVGTLHATLDRVRCMVTEALAGVTLQSLVEPADAAPRRV
jgi:Rrf2 family transcriptional regulator, nitric oxide-sensitive transcriptional repressor